MRKIFFKAKIDTVNPDTLYRSANSHHKKLVYSWDLSEMSINPKDFLFCRVRACSADVPNKNADCFPYDELKKAYPSFTGKGVYQDHKTDSVDDMRGLILDSVFREYDKEIDGGNAWVELLIAIDKSYEDLCRKVSNGSITDVSMGCSVLEGVCSICGNKCRGKMDDYGNVIDMCDHIKFYKGDTFSNKLVYEDCYGVDFLEISMVTDGADSQALILDKNIKFSSEIPVNISPYVTDNLSLKKVANLNSLDVLISDLSDTESQKYFIACTIVNPKDYFTLFSSLQGLTVKQAKNKLLSLSKERSQHINNLI